MTGELEGLRDMALELARAAGDERRDVAERSRRLAERLGQGRLHVAVLGEFKRGKSSFLNALVGQGVLPTGVVPVTTVITQLVHGEPAVTIRFLDGSERCLTAGEDLADYVSEARNPANVLQVAEAEVRLRSPLLAPGLVLVDTPGTGSIHRHNDEVAEKMLLEADGAVVVLSADSPLSERERDLLACLSQREARTYYVLNKADHLSAEELDQVRHFVEDGVASALGRKEKLWCVAALPALRAKEAGRAPGPEAGEFASLESELTRFVTQDLVGLRVVTARQELARIARELLEGIDLVAGALALEESVLAERVTRFREAAGQERQSLADERALLARDVGVLARRVGDDLASSARQAPARWAEELESVARDSRRWGLEDTLRHVVERAVEQSFEAIRKEEANVVEQAWRELAERRRKLLQERVNTLRQLAADLFDIVLPAATIPELAEERERFFYLFIDLGGQIDGLARAARLLLPGRVLRRRLVRQAKDHLAEEMDKHAGRARWDLVQRLEVVHRRFETELAAELERTVATVLQAADRAETLRHRAERERVSLVSADQAARSMACSVLALCGREQASEPTLMANGH